LTNPDKMGIKQFLSVCTFIILCSHPWVLWKESR